MREILGKYCSSLCSCWWILGHFFHPWSVVPMPPLHLLLLPPTPPKQRAEARCSVRSVCHHVSPWWLRASSALAQSSLGFQAYKTGLWSCSHNQMLKGPFCADQWNHCRILEKKNQNKTWSSACSWWATVRVGRPWIRRPGTSVATGQAAAEHIQRGVTVLEASLLLSISLVPSPTWVAYSHSLPEHLITLILMTASLFPPVYWWIIVLFKTVSGVKPGTCQGFHLGVDSLLYPTG